MTGRASLPGKEYARQTESSGPEARASFIFQRLIVFVGEFLRHVPNGRLAACGLLMVLSAVTEGVSLVLLIPLVQLV